MRLWGQAKGDKRGKNISMLIDWLIDSHIHIHIHSHIHTWYRRSSSWRFFRYSFLLVLLSPSSPLTQALYFSCKKFPHLFPIPPPHPFSIPQAKRDGQEEDMSGAWRLRQIGRGSGGGNDARNTKRIMQQAKKKKEDIMKWKYEMTKKIFLLLFGKKEEGGELWRRTTHIEYGC